ncbi:MAG: ATP-binding protein [Arcobacteraceae bacterium]|nr:ATP-binding protein [Arcobacteraceae bacterium]
MQTTNNYKQLIALISVFIIGIFSIVGVNFIFSNLLSNLEKETVNHKTKIAIGEFISHDIEKLRGLFFELATTSSNVRMIKVLDSEIMKVVSNLEKTLYVLENGGKLKRVVRLNIVDLSSIEKEIVYEKKSNDIVMESIDIRPKIEEFLQIKEKLIELVSKRQEAMGEYDLDEFAQSVRDLRLFYRSVPAFFIRFSENNSRLLYEGEKQLNIIEGEIKNKKNHYILVELILVVSILVVVLFLGSMIARSINTTNKKLLDLNNKLNINLEELEQQKLFVRGILDAQSNMVIVTSGDKIIDANRALFEFIEDYINLEEFLLEHDCICDYFVSFNNDSRYILKKNYGDYNWAEYVYNNSNLEHLVAINKDGKTYHFKLNIDRQSFLNEEHILVVAFNDITNEIESQSKLKELNDNLEHIVQEKTQELQELNDNLKQKIIIEVEKNRKKDQQLIQQSRHAALGEMIGNIAHQWRQPLSAISTTASGTKLQMELGLIDNQEIQKVFEDIMEYVKFLNQTIEDFRGFFRQDIKKEPFNVIDVVNNTLKIVSASYKDNDIKIITKFKDSDLRVMGSPSELAQVFLNILNNAKDVLVEKSPQEKKIHIYGEVVGDENLIYIQDNGEGIPIEVIEKVFDPYFTTKHKSQGTGIGLYMSKEIVEKKFEGFLSVKNRDIMIDGESFYGACFIISIPLYKA